MISSLNTTFSGRSTGSARFWIIQHIPDAFRRETRNVGVIVQKANERYTRFFGEGGSSGSFDNRTLRAFKNPKVYRQWVSYWKRFVEDCGDNLEAALKDQVFGNFQAIDGGIIDRTGTDSVEEICDYAYAMLVSEGRLEEALQNEISAAEANVALRDSLAKSFRDLNLMGTGSSLFRKNPIIANQSIIGKKSVHEFSFVQSQSTLDLIEPLNLLTSHKRNTKERAGWMAFAFNDVKSGVRDKAVNAFVVVEMPETEDDATKYCMDMLRDVASVVSWNKPAERTRFLHERELAGSLEL